VATVDLAAHFKYSPIIAQLEMPLSSPATSTELTWREAERTCIGIDHAGGETLARLVGLFLATRAYETDALS
jgi:hypothetical protein